MIANTTITAIPYDDFLSHSHAHSHTHSRGPHSRRLLRALASYAERSREIPNRTITLHLPPDRGQNKRKSKGTKR